MPADNKQKLRGSRAGIVGTGRPGPGLSRKLWRKKLLSAASLFLELLEQKHFGTADDGVDAVPEGFHGRERLERIAKQDDGGVPPLVDGHGLQCLEREIFAKIVGGKKFFEDDDLILHLAEAHEEITVRGGGVNLVAQVAERRPDADLFLLLGLGTCPGYRLMVSPALMVCSVLSTRWPVFRRFNAMRTVSRSRISPTRLLWAPGATRRAGR